jgi:hypothetical protein
MLRHVAEQLARVKGTLPGAPGAGRVPCTASDVVGFVWDVVSRYSV